MKNIIILGILILMSTSVLAQEISVCEGATKWVRNSVLLCEKTYDMDDGISIGKDNSFLNCNGATIKGKGSGNGITVKSYNYVKISNCVIEGFENGIYFERSENNTISGNTFNEIPVGVKLVDSQTFYSGNIYNNVGLQIDDDSVEKVAEPISQPIAEPIPQPIAEPEPTPVAEPVPQPIAEPTPKPIAQPDAEPVVEPKSNLTLYLLLGVIVLLVIILGVVYFKKNKPKKNVEEMLINRH